MQKKKKKILRVDVLDSYEKEALIILEKVMAAGSS